MRELGHSPANSATVQAHMGENPDGGSNKRIYFSSRALGWPGVLVEGGVDQDGGVSDTSVPFVYIALNTSAEALTISRRDEGRTTRHVVAPGALWIHPNDTPMTMTAHGRVEFVHALFDPTLLTHLSGHDEPVSFGISIEEPPFTHLLRALSEEVRLHNPNGRSFERTLTTAIAGYLARRFSAAPMKVGVERLSAMQHRQALEFIEDRLDVGATVDEIAAHLRMSPFHFARAFRNAVGMSPHAFLIERRLQRAREALSGGHLSVSDAAGRFGFADRCHFARLFRRRYGEPPSAVVKRGRR